MREWNGHDDSASVVGQGSASARNVSFAVDSELRVRAGLGDKFATYGRSLASYNDGTTEYLFTLRDTAIYSNPFTQAETSRKTGLDGTAYGSWALINSRLYFSNGVDAMQGFTPAVATVGITAPTAPAAADTGTGVITAGTHLVRIRLKHTATGYYSDPCAPVTYTAATAKQLSVTSIPATPAGHTTLVEMTPINSSTYYIAGTTTSTSTTINLADATLAVQAAVNTYASPDGYGHGLPPIAGLICEHRNRMFAWKTTTAGGDLLFWSRASFPEGFNQTDWARAVFPGGSDRPTGIASFYGDLYLMGQRSMRRLVYTDDPASGMLVSIPTDLGLWNQRCLVFADGKMFGWGSSGVWVVDGIQPKHLSRKVDTTWRAALDVTKAAQCHGYFDPTDRMVWWWYCSAADAAPKQAIGFHLDTGKWSLGTSLGASLIASCVYGSATRGTAAYLSDSQSHTWKWMQARWDGVPSALASGAVTVTTGATTTSLPVAQSLPTGSGTDCTGAFLYRPSTGESRRIASNTASIITTAAFSTAGSNGEEFWIGPIDAQVIERWLPASDDWDESRPSYAVVSHVADAGVIYSMSLYLDFSASAVGVGTLSLSGANPRGVTPVSSNNSLTLDGQFPSLAVPSPSDWNDCIRWGIVQRKPAGTMKLLDVVWQMPPRDKPRVDSQE